MCIVCVYVKLMEIKETYSQPVKPAIQQTIQKYDRDE